MRIALLISGEFREFEIAHKFWPFLNWEGIDIYFSVWYKSTIYYSDGSFITEPVNFRVMNSLNPKAIIADHQPVIEIHNALKMIHRLKRGFSHILNSGIEYDLVITVRPDFVSYAKDEYYIKQVERAYREQICMIDGFNHVGKTSGDSIIVYPIKYVKDFVNFTFEDLFTKSPSGYYFGDIHKIFGTYFSDKADEMPGMSNTISIARVNARELSPAQQRSFRMIDLKSEEWWNKRHGHSYMRRNYNDPNCS